MIKQNPFKGMPKWLAAVNISILLPISLWPIVAFASIFAMDDPNHQIRGMVIFLLGICYPAILIGLAWANITLYRNGKAWGIFMPILYFFALYGFVAYAWTQILNP